MNIKTYIRIVSVTLLYSGYAISAPKLPGPIVETNWLANNKNQVTILSVRKDIKSFTSKPIYSKDKKSGKKKLVRVGGHIPGALLINYKNIRVKRKINGKTITRIIPDTKTFEVLMQKAGVKKETTLIIVSKGQHNGDVTMATRLYWQLKYFGHKSIAILNGGTAQWTLDGRSIASNLSTAVMGNWTAGQIQPNILATSKAVAAAIKNGKTQLIDVRSPAFFHGTYKKSYVFAKGHIRGAHNFPNELLTHAKMPTRFLSTKQYKALNKNIGISSTKKTITYCNSGHLASGSWFIMSEVLGNKNSKLYDGSMHQWTLEKRPVIGL